GDDGVAAFSVTCYLAPVVFMIYAAISQSAQPMLSYSFGAGDFARVGKVLRLISVLSVAAGVVMALGLSIFCKPVLSIFLDRGSSAFDMCAYGFPLFTVGFAFMAVNITFIGYAQSVKKSILSAVLTTLRGMILPSLTFILMPMLWGVNGLWLAVPAAELFITLAIVALWGLGIFHLR
ncbi:MAG: MATE family efflux transporter, partial [Bacteroidales bacterium]|nr:MATE family efflux transporter [Bacteroidales bacterium]